MVAVTSPGDFRYGHRFIPERRRDSFVVVCSRVLSRVTRGTAGGCGISTLRGTSRYPFTVAGFAANLGLHAGRKGDFRDDPHDYLPEDVRPPRPPGAPSHDPG